jgi:putative nucleotidyltransferase with HDIG domain
VDREAMSASILIVDDEPAVRDVLSSWLEAAGYRCALAGEAGEALERLAEGDVDVALLDFILPGRDGLWLAGVVRERHPDVGVVLVTGYQGCEVAAEGLRLGVLDFLLKPFSRRELMQAVRRAVEWRDSLRRDREAERAIRHGIAQRHDALVAAVSGTRDARTAVSTLLEAIGERHPDAVAHARRVGAMALALARALSVEGPVLEEVEHGALLHDVGKALLPASLIRRAGPLADEEIALIRTHVQLGAAVVRAVPGLEGAAAIVAASHEAWDGSGHPDGLAGEAIPIGARIVAVVDTFDALTCAQPDDALASVRAAAELVRCAGSQFDPAVVHAWLRVAEIWRPGGRDPDGSGGRTAALQVVR